MPGRGDLEPVTLASGEDSRRLASRSRPSPSFRDRPPGLAPVSRSPANGHGDVAVAPEEWRRLLQWQRQSEKRMNELMQLEKAQR